MPNQQNSSGGMWVPINGTGPSIPADQFVSDEDMQQERYGTPQQQTIAAIESLSRGASFGLSDKLLTETGTPAEDIRGRMEANPITSAVGNIAGSVKTLGLIPIGATAEAALAPKVGALAARGLGYGAEGAALGAGNTITDQALGDTRINASKVLSDLGMGFAFGSGLGLLSKGIEATPALFKKASIEAPSSLESAIDGTAANSVIDAPEPSMGLKPTSIDEIQARVKDAAYRGEGIEMPAKNVLEDAASRVEMLNPIHPLQLESLNNQSARDLYKTAIEMPGKEGDALRGYEALQKQELVKQTQNTIKNLALEAKLTSDATEAGNQAIDIFKDQYQTEKDLLSPAFEAIKKTDIGNIDHLPGVLNKMTDAVPGVARMFNTEGSTVSIKPYKTSWGIDKATYSAVKQAVESLEEAGPKSFEELSNIRKGLDQNIDILAKGQAPQEIMALKKSMMDYMQDVLQGAEGSQATDVRELFKRYAINEQERGVIEKAFGASVGSPEFGAISKIKPEMISDRIFANTATTKAAKNILPQDKFQHLLGNWMSEQIEKVTDKGAFSSNKFGSFLKKNADVLNEAFANNPQALTRLKDLNNIARILPDSTSINPSGTAKTLLGILKAHSLGDFIGNIKGYAAEKLQQKIINEKLNAALAGKADQATKLSVIKRTIEKTNEKIEKGAKAIFSDTGRRGLESGLINVTDQEYNKRVNRLSELANDPQAMMNHMSDSTDALYAAAPNITQDINNKMVAGLQFLQSKIPTTQTHMPLSAEYVPSEAEKDKFNTYYDAVNDPTHVFSLIKDNTLTNETMEALNTVHPEMLNDMRKKVLENFDPKTAQDLDYATKLSLSQFLGEPLDENMLPQAFQSYQASLTGPNASQQQAAMSGKSTLGGMKELDVANRSLTRSQDLQKNEET